MKVIRWKEEDIKSNFSYSTPQDIFAIEAVYVRGMESMHLGAKMKSLKIRKQRCFPYISPASETLVTYALSQKTP